VGLKITASALVAAVAAIVSLIIVVVHLDGRLNHIGGTYATTANVSDLQRQITSLEREDKTLSVLTQQIQSSSPTGTLITCKDLSQFQDQEDLQLYGTDSMNGSISGTAALSGNPWLPAHCFKS